VSRCEKDLVLKQKTWRKQRREAKMPLTIDQGLGCIFVVRMHFVCAVFNATSLSEYLLLLRCQNIVYSVDVVSRCRQFFSAY
jgi:hypothetical protein